MCGDSCWTESVVKNGLDYGIFAFDVVVNGKREVWNAHAVMSVAKRMDPREFREVFKCTAYVVHEMIQNPVASGGVEVLCLHEVEFR